MPRSAERVTVSTVTPMHNEEECVAEFVRRTDAVLSRLGSSYEILVVSDGSTDRTESLLRALAQRTPALRVLCLARNMGQCAAIDAGIQHSRGDQVVILDGDLQNRPEDIPLLLEEARRGFDLVSGLRRGREESVFLRRVPSLVANWLLRRVTGCPVRDMGGFKCIRGDLARSLRLRAGQHRLLPALVWQRGGSVTEIDVEAAPRHGGRSHYGLSRTLDVLLDIVMLWFQSSFRSRPIYLFGRISIGITVVASIMLSVLLWQKFVDGVSMGTRPPFLISIMLYLASLFVLASGFVLELLSDALSAATRVRPWIVRERLGGPADTNLGMGTMATSRETIVSLDVTRTSEVAAVTGSAAVDAEQVAISPAARPAPVTSGRSPTS